MPKQSNGSVAMFDLTAEVPYPRPSRDEVEWQVNQAAAKKELYKNIEAFGDDLPATFIYEWHKKWFYPAGHKALGRMLDALAAVPQDRD